MKRSGYRTGENAQEEQERYPDVISLARYA